MIGVRARRAAAAVEFALVAPFLVLAMLATVDLTTYIRAYFRVERVAAEVTNLASQYERLREQDIARLFDAAQMIAGPIQVKQTAGRTIISLVEGTTQGNRMRWQRASVGVPANQFASRIGVPPNIVTLPAGMTVPVGPTVLIVEVFNRRLPWLLSADFLGTGAPEVIYAFYIMRPRSAQLAEILP